jgi:O-antigen/teichoic acid export membrane protein
MGIVYKQSAINTIILFVGFFIGGINVLFLYTHFLDNEYYGLIAFLLSTANILLPLIIFGMQSTVVKFFSSYTSKDAQDRFLTTSLFFPLVIIIPLTFIGIFAYETISSWISDKNPLIKDYTYLIFFVAIFMGYFELFYAWSKVKFESVVGSFIKEVFARFCTSLLLVAVYFNYLTNEQFIYGVVIIYGLRVLIMLIYALYLYTPKLIFALPDNFKEIIYYSFFIILASSAGGILLEIDKFMIPQLRVGLEKVAYYSVGVYIATVVAIPARAMLQIATPITAKALNDNNISEVKKLYKNSSINMLIVGGLLFLLINLNVADLYQIINKPEYAAGISIVFMISIAKLFELALGTNSAILSNSNYYKVYFIFSVAMAASVIILNRWLIGLYGNDGAALATLIVVVLYGFVKIFYIQKKLKIQPFTIKTLLILGIVFVLFLPFYWIQFRFNMYLNIIFRSVLLSIIYLFMVYKLDVSIEFNRLIKKYLKL